MAMPVVRPGKGPARASRARRQTGASSSGAEANRVAVTRERQTRKKPRTASNDVSRKAASGKASPGRTTVGKATYRQMTSGRRKSEKALGKGDFPTGKGRENSLPKIEVRKDGVPERFVVPHPGRYHAPKVSSTRVACTARMWSRRRSMRTSACSAWRPVPKCWISTRA